MYSIILLELPTISNAVAKTKQTIKKHKTVEFTHQNRLNVCILLDIITIAELALLIEVCTECWRSIEEGETKSIA